MIYVKRDDEGSILEMELSPSHNHEEICLTSSELIDFIKDSPDREALTREALDQLDLDMVRVIEDLIDIMIDRGLMRFTDLPIPVQKKLLFKRKIRDISNVSDNFDEEELINL